jgi:hypothetical protein
MIRNLYYLTLANNLGVIHWVLHSAEEEEFKEAFLAYFVLWRSTEAEGLEIERLDEAVEALVQSVTGQAIDFEIRDALGKLNRLGLVREVAGGRFRAVPIEQALVVLDELWDHIFRYAEHAAEARARRGPA